MFIRSETEKRQRKRRARAAQEARVKAAEKRAEEERAATIAAMRAFTVDLEARQKVYSVTLCSMLCIDSPHR